MLEVNSPFDSRLQPGIESLMQRLGEEISAKAVLLLHENGQVVSRAGWIEEHEFPATAALVAAMIAAGKSLGGLGDTFGGSPSRFSYDSDLGGLYTVEVQPGFWLAALFEQPLNPGQLRMKVRRYARICAQLGTGLPPQWEMTENVTTTGVNLPPRTSSDTTLPETITEKDTSLFTNITDDEIDRLFEDSSS